MVPIKFSHRVVRPAALLAALIGLVLLLPGALALDADASVSGPMDASPELVTPSDDAVVPPDAVPTGPTSIEAPDASDPDALVQKAHTVVGDARQRVHDASGGLSIGPSEGVTETLGTKSAGQSRAPQGGMTQVLSEDTVQNGAMALGGAGLLGVLFWAKNMLGLAGSRFLLAPLFSRIDKDDMLENEGRELLYNLIQTNPGISLSELSDQSGLGWGTTVYHLGRLEQSGFVSSMRQGQTRHFFEKGKGPAAQKTHIAVLKNPTAGDMARFLLSRPGATQSAIGQALGIKAPVVTKYVKRLAGEGLVNVSPEGRSKVITPTTELSEAMLRLEAPAGGTIGATPAMGQGPLATAA